MDKIVVGTSVHFMPRLYIAATKPPTSCVIPPPITNNLFFLLNFTSNNRSTIFKTLSIVLLFSIASKINTYLESMFCKQVLSK